VSGTAANLKWSNHGLTMNLSVVFILLVFGVLGHNITLSVQLLFCGPSEHKMLEKLHKTDELPEFHCHILRAHVVE
jgi:hypothetical protein